MTREELGERNRGRPRETPGVPGEECQAPAHRHRSPDTTLSEARSFSGRMLPGETEGQVGFRIETWGDLLREFSPTRLYHRLSAYRVARKLSSRSGIYDYAFRYSNKAEGYPQLTPRMREEINRIFLWAADPELSGMKFAYLGFGYSVVDQAEHGGHRSFSASASRPFAHTALRYYQSMCKESPELSAALHHASEFFHTRGVHYQSFGWWLVSTFEANRADRTALAKALHEALPMTMVAKSAPAIFTAGKDWFAISIQPAKENVIIQAEELIPSFDFRVHVQDLASTDSASSPVAFFEVKRVEELLRAKDITSVIRTTMRNKLHRVYENLNGAQTSLAAHLGLKVVVIQAPWPQSGVPFTSKNRKGGFTTLYADGAMDTGFIRDGKKKVLSTSSMFDELATKLKELDPEGQIDAVYLTGHQGELIQTFYHSGSPINGQMLLTNYRPEGLANWKACGKREISPWSYMLSGDHKPHQDFIEELRDRDWQLRQAES